MKKEKIETEAQREARKAREAREIARLEREKAKPRYAGYAFYFLFVIAIVYLVDEVTTNSGKFMGTIVADYFFENGNAQGNTIKTICEFGIMLFSAVAMVLRPLADRYGRKLFLVLYTIGMGLGLGIIGVSHRLPGYVVGSILIQFCVPHDVHVIYIQECAPAEKRGTYFSLTKGLATCGLVLIPLFRDIFKVNEVGHPEAWRSIYLMIGLIGLVIAIIAAILMRESDVYINNRLEQLRLSDEERARIKAQEGIDREKYGLLQGLKHLFRNKQLLWLGISFGFVFIAYQLTSNYDVILKYGWGMKTIPDFDPMMFLNDEALSVAGNARINQMLYFYPVGCALIEFLPGFLADKIGRKKATSFFAVSAIASYVLFYIGAMNAWNPHLLGFLIGAACGSVWSYGDLLLLMTSESVETNLRVSVNTATYIFSGSFCGVGMGIFALCTLSGNDALIAPVTLGLAVVGLTVGSFFLFAKVKDTKDVDINTVKASDFN